MLSLLRAAGLEERDGFAVFVRDIPWAMPLDMPVALQHGDLIQVLPVSHDEVATFSLPDMLSSTEGWDTAWLPPGEWENNAWVLARLENFTFRIAPFRSLQVRADLALGVGTPESNLIVCPARPQVDNLAFRGRMSRNILVAIAGEHGRHYSQPRLTICILDLRAILQGFSWYALPDGILHHDRVASRFGPRCPEGYSLGRLMPDGSIRLLQEPISVHDGEVVCLTFFIPPPENLSSSEYSSDESDNGGSDHEGNEFERRSSNTGDPDPEESSVVTASSALSRGGDAGTGGSRTAGCSETQHAPACGQSIATNICWGWLGVEVDLCRTLSCADALVESSGCDTSILRLL